MGETHTRLRAVVYRRVSGVKSAGGEVIGPVYERCHGCGPRLVGCVGDVARD